MFPRPSGRILVALGLLAVPAAARAAAAQDLVPEGEGSRVRLGIVAGGGITQPLGNLQLEYGTGFHGFAGLEAGKPDGLLVVRAEGMFHRLLGQRLDQSDDDIRGVLGSVLVFPLARRDPSVSPYLIAGGGWINERLRGGTTGTPVPDFNRSDAGMQVGGGARVRAGTVAFFGEVRWVRAFRTNGVSVIPVSIGISLGR